MTYRRQWKCVNNQLSKLCFSFYAFLFFVITGILQICRKSEKDIAIDCKKVSARIDFLVEHLVHREPQQSFTNHFESVTPSHFYNADNFCFYAKCS